MSPVVKSIIESGLQLYPIPHKSAKEADRLQEYVANAIASQKIDTDGLSVSDFAIDSIHHYYGELLYED